MTRVLVVEDEAVVREVMVEMLARAGYEVVAVESAAAARQRVDDPAVALVVCDVHLPGVSGLELAGELRARRDLPVLLVTGAGTAGLEAEALARGATALLGKPFGQADLVAAVAAALGRVEGP